MVLLRSLPAEAPLWAELEEAEAEAKKPKPDRIRKAKADFEARNRRALGGVSDG